MVRQVEALGYVGVTFSFVCRVSCCRGKTPVGLSARHFYGRRFARVYPTHALTTGIAVLVTPWVSPIVAGTLAAHYLLHVGGALAMTVVLPERGHEATR